MLAVEAVLLLWNAWRFDWLRGYDAFADDGYAKIVSTEYRLPSVEESDAWHTPPLWFALAGALRRVAGAMGWEPVQRPGQLLAAAAGLAICVLVLLLARQLWPGRRMLHLVALVLTAASPALVRASAMYHPETLAVALATGGVLVAVRGLQTRSTLWTGAGAGALLGLAALTRAWALPVLVAVLVAVGLDAWGRKSWAPAAALLATSVALLGPWLVNQEVAHGSALAFNRPAPPGSMLTRRPASFYLGPRALRVFEHPVTPLFRNELLPHLYADWWGDWALTWNSPPPPAPGELLPPRVVADRARQMFVGVVPSVLALAGIFALALLAERAAVRCDRRAAAERRRARDGVRRVRGAVPVDGRRHDQGDVSAHGPARGVPRSGVRRRRAAPPWPRLGDRHGRRRRGRGRGPAALPGPLTPRPRRYAPTSR